MTDTSVVVESNGAGKRRGPAPKKPAERAPGAAALPLPPGSDGIPWLGEALDFRKDSRAFFLERYRKYGPVFRTRIAGQPIVCFVGPTALEFFLNPEYFTNDGANPTQVRELLMRDALPLIGGAKHAARKALVAQAFEPAWLERYLPLIVRVTDGFIARWERRERFDWLLEFQKFAATIASNLFLGTEPGDPKLRLTLDAYIAGFAAPPINAPFTPYRRALKARDQLVTLLNQAIQVHRERAQPDVLSALLAARGTDGRGLSHQQLRNELLHLFFAGYAGMAIGCLTQCFAVGTHPDVMARVRRDVTAQAPQGTKLTLGVLQRMEYVRAVSREARRKYPVLPNTFFRKIRRDCEFGGRRIPAGWLAMGGLHATMLDLQSFTEPDAFDPDRFTRTPAEPLLPNGYCPHSAGAHRCVGESLIDVLLPAVSILLLRNHAWSFDSPTFEYTSELLAVPRDGLMVRFHRVQG